MQVISDIFKRRYGNPKPLVLSFHGSTGTGKTFFRSILSKMLFQKGVKSDYVHIFYVSLDFPDSSKVAEYKVSIELSFLPCIAFL